MLADRLKLGISLGLLGLTPFILPGVTGNIFFLILSTLFTFFLLSELDQVINCIGLHSYSRITACFGSIWILIAGTLLFMKDGDSMIVNGGWILAPSLFLLLLILKAPPEINRKAAAEKLLVSISALMFFLYTLGLMPHIYFWQDPSPFEASGRVVLLYLIIVTKGADIGAYIAGSLTARRRNGNHKMMKKLSPGKSWEGLAGGLVASVIAALAFILPRQALFSETPLIGELATAVLFGLLCALTGLAGDIFASFLKRAANVKDSGRIPGLGGMLDIFDSLIFTVPFFYAYLYFI